MIKMMKAAIREYLAKIGKKGGTKSRRVLPPEVARQMVRVRIARRAFRTFYSQCFWSFSPKTKISEKDIAWVSEQLMKNGGREAWKVGAKLCR